MINNFFNTYLHQGCLILFIILQFLLSFFMPAKFYKYAKFISFAGILFSMVLLFFSQTETQKFGFYNSITIDNYTLMFHFLILICGAVCVLLLTNLLRTIKENAYIFQTIYLTAVLSSMNIVSSNDFLTLFISIELLSFSVYFLIASAKGYYSKEASFKYLLTNAVASGIFLFGVSYLYGLTSSLNFTEISTFVSDKNLTLLYNISAIMIMLGLISKLALFPFANWIIDVFKGTETSILAFLSTVPKLAFFGIVCKLLFFTMSGIQLTFILAILSILTAFWANIFAIKEKNVKAILACSSAANASYVMVVASIVSVYNLSSVIFYLISYIFMNIGVFAFLNITENNNIGMNVENYTGLYHKHKWQVLAYTLLIIGLAGFPVTSGFVAKIYLFSAIANSGLIFIPFLIMLLLLTVVALYYYLKLIHPLFIETDNLSARKSLKTLYSQNIVLIACTIITFIIGIYPEKVIELCKFIAYNI